MSYKVKSGKIERDKKPDLAFRPDLALRSRSKAVSERIALLKEEIALLSEAEFTEHEADLTKRVVLLREEIARLEAETGSLEGACREIEPMLRAMVANGWMVRRDDFFSLSEKFDQLRRRLGRWPTVDDVYAHDRRTGNPSLDQLEDIFKKSQRSDH
jgi:uncharacterized small protein (DUF1192 family)